MQKLERLASSAREDRLKRIPRLYIPPNVRHIPVCVHRKGVLSHRVLRGGMDVELNQIVAFAIEF